MTKQEKIKMGVGLAASIGAGAVVNRLLIPSTNDVKGGKVMRILAFIGSFALAGAAADIAGKHMEKTIDSIYELPGLIKELKTK